MLKHFFTLAIFCWVNLAFAQHPQQDSIYSYEIADKAPVPIGGEVVKINWIRENINRKLFTRPDTLDCSSITKGNVIVRYVIDETGNLTNAEIAFGLGGVYDREALRLITQMPVKWIPGVKDGQNTKVRYHTSIAFCNINSNKRKGKKKQ